jgi:hypothetical protein
MRRSRYLAGPGTPGEEDGARISEKRKKEIGTSSGETGLRIQSVSPPDTDIPKLDFKNVNLSAPYKRSPFWSRSPPC